MNILILGDIHGAWEGADSVYDHAIRTKGVTPDLLIQVGDFGYFPYLYPESSWKREFPHPCVFIDGNHEDHPALRLHKEKIWGIWEYMRRGTFRDGILYIGGARSIDANRRTKFVDWFPEEDISYSDQSDVLNTIEKHRGEIHTVISHDCPSMFDVTEGCTSTGKMTIDGNRKFLQHVLEEVRPQRWFFGHYHHSMQGKNMGCEWRCLDMAPFTDNDKRIHTLDHAWIQI